MAVQIIGPSGYIADVDSSNNLKVTLAFSDIGGLALVGTLTHNSAAPAASTQLGVLPAVASSAAPTYTTGYQVLLSTDLSGNLRTISAFPATPIIYLEGHAGGVLDAVLGAAKPANVLQVGGNDGTNAYGIPLASGGGTVLVHDASPASQAVTNAGTFAVQAACTVASGGIVSGAIASGAVASGAIAAGAIASGAAVSGAFADGALVTLGSKADAKSTATDTTAITIMQVLKEISYMVQNPASIAVTNAGTFAVQAAQSGTWTMTSVPATSGGCSTAVSQALTTTINVKSSTGQLYGYTLSNPNSTPVYVTFYNTATTPGTIGSSTNLLMEIMIPGGATANMEWSNGIAFSAGIAIAVATTATGNTPPGTGIVTTTLYK